MMIMTLKPGPRQTPFLALFIILFATACTDPDQEAPFEREPGPHFDNIYSLAHGCFIIDAALPNSPPKGLLASTSDTAGFDFKAHTPEQASRFRMQPSDLGTYLLFDDDEHYLVVENAEKPGFLRKSTLLSDILTVDDDYLPGAQWILETSTHDDSRFELRHLKTGLYLTLDGLTEDTNQAAILTFYEAEDCAVFPELSLDAQGEVTPRQFEDGSLFGIVDTHSHIFSNFGFGGAGIFHGAPYHPLGVEHALPSCEQFHGEEGRSDLFGYGYDHADDADEIALLQGLATGQTPDFNHHTEGYPDFTEWPSAHFSSTHQTQYYRWLERAWRAGLRLVVQHATSNEVICELIYGTGAQPIRYSCNDMVAAHRTILEARKMERYIDAQQGGPGKGWFRIVESPEQAREVINQGKLAVILGLEVSNLFDCYLVPPPGVEPCTEQDVLDALDRYIDLGIRAIFPVHKYDNAFSAGDGHREIIELGNFIQTGHWSNFTDDCPDLPTVFDRGDVAFGGLNEPRDDYFATPPNDMSGFHFNPFETLKPHLGRFLGGPLRGDYCQKAGLTDLGEFLLMELMKRGIIIELDHFPRRSYQRAFEILQDHDYPAAGTHGNSMRGELYELGGISKFNFGRCNPEGQTNTLGDPLRNRLAMLEAAGAFPAEGFGFDFNGFAGAPGPRFGDRSLCTAPQQNPITYPFKSFDGDHTFTQPFVGNRAIDFNTEGMAHIGLLPELIQDLRNDGMTDEELEPLFKSAEAYIRMWERAIERSQTINPR